MSLSHFRGSWGSSSGKKAAIVGEACVRVFSESSFMQMLSGFLLLDDVMPGELSYLGSLNLVRSKICSSVASSLSPWNFFSTSTLNISTVWRNEVSRGAHEFTDRLKFVFCVRNVS